MTEHTEPIESHQLTEGERSFHMKEYEALRNEIELHIQERRKVENQSVIGALAVYAWLVTRPPDTDFSLLKFALIIPIAIGVIGVFRWLGIMWRTMELGAYIRKIESLVAGEGLGWEHSLSDRRRTFPIRHRLEGWSGALFWAALIAGSFLVSRLLYAEMSS